MSGPQARCFSAATILVVGGLIACAGLFFPACGGQDGGPNNGTSGGAGGGSDDGSGAEAGEESGETGELLPEGPFSDNCIEAPTLDPGRYIGSLRGRDQDFGGACGLGGSQVFFAVQFEEDADLIVDARADGFEPRVELLSAQCVEGSSFSCTEQGSATLFSLRGGTRVVASVGVDPLDPIFDTPEGLADPLIFELIVDRRGVFGEGDPCGANTVGRCDGGLSCEIAPDGYERCIALPGDNCASALALDLPQPGQSVQVELDLDAAVGRAGDRHHQSCTGNRQRDWVYRIDRHSLEALEAVPGDHLIELQSSAEGVGIALRAPGCRLSEEQACAEEISAAALAVPVQSLVSERDGDAYLIVELPADAQGVISLALSVVDA